MLRAWAPFLVLLAACGRSGFETNAREPQSVVGGTCGRLTGFGDPIVLADPPLLPGNVQPANGRYSVAGWIPDTSDHATASVAGYDLENNVWAVSDVYDGGPGTVYQAGASAITGSQFFYIGNDVAQTSAFVRRGPAPWATALESPSTLAVDIETPSENVIVFVGNRLLAGAWTAWRSNNAGATFDVVDTALAVGNATVGALANLNIGVLALGKVETPTGAAWVARLTRDPDAAEWNDLGPWFVDDKYGTGAQAAVTFGDTLYIAGLRGSAGLRIARIEDDGSAKEVFVLGDQSDDTSFSSRTLQHSSGCTLMFGTDTRAHIIGSANGAEWRDYPIDLLLIRNAIELDNGDLLMSVALTNRYGTLVRLPVLRE